MRIGLECDRVRLNSRAVVAGGENRAQPWVGECCVSKCLPIRPRRLLLSLPTIQSTAGTWLDCAVGMDSYQLRNPTRKQATITTIRLVLVARHNRFRRGSYPKTKRTVRAMEEDSRRQTTLLINGNLAHEVQGHLPISRSRNVAHRAEAVTAIATETAVFSGRSYRNARLGVGK